VINVTWDDAKDYARWLSQMTGHEYRLLTEAEWEYAARGVTSANDLRNGEIYSFGDDVRQLGDYAWLGENSNERAHPVATKRVNPFGLYDMHGNVGEWVEDCFATYNVERLTSAAVEADSDDSPGDASCSLRVVRGGSWNDYAEGLRSAIRARGQPNARHYAIGFRVARTL
jgi:formylglycine-generating enzyme required for sulfatase activity